MTTHSPGLVQAKTVLLICKYMTTHSPGLYPSNIQQLLHCETLENFNDLYDSLSATWSEAFVIYFEDHLKTDFINNAIRMNFCAVFVDLEI